MFRTLLHIRVSRSYIILYYIISYHIISYHIISYHIISYHIISYHIILYVSMYIVYNVLYLLYWHTVDERPPSIHISTRLEVHWAECSTRCVKWDTQHRLVSLSNRKAMSLLNCVTVASANIRWLTIQSPCDRISEVWIVLVVNLITLDVEQRTKHNWSRHGCISRLEQNNLNPRHNNTFFDVDSMLSNDWTMTGDVS